MRTLEDLIRPNIKKLKPYSSARNEFHGNASVFMDANENPFDSGINRYPDPIQLDVKRKIAELKGLIPEKIFLGNGSDEAIDLLMRAFCEPGIDNIVSIDPSYGMYEVAANINNIEFRKVQLTEDFHIDISSLLDRIDLKTKIIYLCSPNNPTGNCLNRNDLHEILRSFDGLVVIDEAYIDFASAPSFINDLDKFPKLVILQTLSKAWGAAGIRVGMAFADERIISILNKIKYPYNINVLTQKRVLDLLNDREEMKKQLNIILQERDRMIEAFENIKAIKKIYPTDSNFILVKVDDANSLYNSLVEKGIIVRNRTNITLCSGCLRITVGTKSENDRLFESLKQL